MSMNTEAISGVGIQKQSQISSQLEPQESLQANSVIVKSEGQYTLAQVAVVIDDYFKKPKRESVAESAAKLRKQMEANNAAFKKAVKKLDDVVS